MKYPEIKHLYKYRPFNEFTLEIISDGLIFFPKPDLFNDPYDCTVKIDYNLSVDEFVEILRKYDHKHGVDESVTERKINEVKNNNKVPKDFENNFKVGIDDHYQKIRNVGVLSLAEDCRNLLMWAHYADDHKGICIEFERTRENILGIDQIANPIKYIKSYPKVSYKNFFHEPDHKHIAKKMFWSKSDHWSYENEWRVISEEGNICKPIPGSITSIIFGMRASERSIGIIKKLTEGTDIKLKKAVKLSNEFGLKVVNAI